MEFISALGSFLGFTTPEEPDEIILVEPPDLPQRKFTLKELQSFNGKNLISEYSKECKPVYLALLGVVFDVTHNGGLAFYGPDGPYAALAGRDSTRSLSTMELEKVHESFDLDDTSDLSEDQLKTAKEWFDKFKSKYIVRGQLVSQQEDQKSQCKLK